MRPVSAVRLSLLVLLLVLYSPVAAQMALGGLDPETPVEIDADELSLEPDGTIHAAGGVRVRAGELRLAAGRIIYDTETGLATLEGGVTLIDGAFVARAERGDFDLSTGTGSLHAVSLWQKRDPAAPDLLLDLPGPALGALGHNEVTILADSVVRGADGAFTAFGPSVTLCDCGDDPPSWSVSASRASLGDDRRLDLDWPVFRIRGVPVLGLPWFSLPATSEEERQTGLLAPEVEIFSRRGFSWEQPLFLELGRSWDATISAGYFFGSQDERTVPRHLGLPQSGTEQEVDRAFKGPRLSGELRYAPRIGTDGRLFGAWAWDGSYRLPTRGSILPGRRPADPDLDVPVASPHRWFLQWDHADDLPGGFSDRIALNLASDRFYLRDFTDEVVRRGRGVLTSSAWLGWHGGSALVAAEGTWLQDLRLPFRSEAAVPAGFLESPELFGSSRRNTFARLPALALDLAHLPLPGGLALSLHAGAAHFSPFNRTGFGDEGVDGLGPGDRGYPGPDEGEGDGIFQQGERAAATRLALRPTLSLPIVAGRTLSLTPSVGWRQMAWLRERTGDGHAGWGVLGLDAHTELARTFGAGRLRHAWVPRLQLRGLLPGDATAAPDRPYDELDVHPLEAFAQGRASLGTRLDLARQGGAVVGLEAEVGQDFLLAPAAEAAASYVRADLDLRPVRLEGLLRWDREGDAPSEVAADASLTARRGHQLRAGYRRIAVGGSSRLLAGPDELFAPGSVAGERLASHLIDPTIVGEIHQIGGGATWFPLAPLLLRYDLLYLFTLEDRPLLEQRAAIGWTSPCDCWSAEIRLALRRNEPLPDVAFFLDIGGLLQL